MMMGGEVAVAEILKKKLKVRFRCQYLPVWWSNGGQKSTAFEIREWVD